MRDSGSITSRIRVVCLVFALLGLSSGIAQAQVVSVTIDFERFPGPDGILGTADDTVPACNFICENLGSQFASMGITFTSGGLEQGSFFPGSSLSNRFISAVPPDATFSVPVSGISITSFSIWTATLYALDEANNVIASNTLTNPNAGSSFLLGTLRLSASRPIRRFTVLPTGCPIGSPTPPAPRPEPCDRILNLDNLVLTSDPAILAPAAVPAVTGWGILVLLVLLGAVGAIVIGRGPFAGA